jgi:N-ethylmaleimide reductase
VKLSTSTHLGKLRLGNRVVMAPMTRSRADASGLVGELTVRYYAQRATAGLLITEATNVSADAVGSPLTPGIWSDAQIDAWKKVTSAVHAAGGAIVMQLWHTGRVGHSEVRGGRLPVAPSAIAIQGQKHFTASGPKDYEVPRALTTDEVCATIDDFEKGAKNAKAAGFDGVELHGAFGYLPHQFLVDSSNQRTDEYGGRIENRARFVLEVMERLVRVWGEGRVGIRLSPTLAYNGMVDSDPRATFSYVIDKLNVLPLAYLHLMRATPDAERFPHWPKDTIATFGPLFRGPLIVNGGYDRDSAEAVLDAGAAHAVSFGAPFVSNPDLVHRFETGAPLAPGDRSTFYGGGEKGYVDYPALPRDAAPVAKGYWLVLASVTNPGQFGKYTAVAGPTLASYGGRVLARGDVSEVVEGAVPRRPYLVEFPSYAAARACFHSAAYQDAIALRAGAAEFDIVVIEGMPSGQAPAR